ncbi:MAG: hypothetical protein H6577_22680 [Lewinellaceae bacterium]|nr:hypothetical protein [Lewinellaceae bacterium]
MKTVKNLQFAIILSASMLSINSFAATVLPTNGSPYALEINDDVCEGEVKIVNRSCFPVVVHINGYYVGTVDGKDYEYFDVPRGSNYVQVTWSNGFYQYWSPWVSCDDTVTLKTTD